MDALTCLQKVVSALESAGLDVSSMSLTCKDDDFGKILFSLMKAVKFQNQDRPSTMDEIKILGLRINRSKECAHDFGAYLLPEGGFGATCKKCGERKSSY